MMEFARPHILWALLAVVPVAFWLVLGVRRARAGLVRFSGDGLSETLAPGYSWRKHLLKGTLNTVALALIIVALAGPRFGTRLVKVDREGIDVVVALDTSLSMLAEDMLPNRLERAKQAIVDLIKGLQGDRVGLVVFAGDAYALCPLTVDYDAALMFARTVDVDMVSEPGTAIDKAIAASVALFDESTKRDRAVIVVTDGENHEGDAVAEAQKAADKNIRIFTIGIGNPAGELIPERAGDGTIAGYKKDRRGETVLTRLDEKTLQEVAAAANGKYLPATREGLELRVLYHEISGMERKAIQGEFVERRKERFWMFLAAALALLLLDALVSTRATGLARRSQRYLHTGVPLLLVAAVALAAGPASAKKVDRGRVESGNEYYRSGEYDKARTLYREALGDTTRLVDGYQGVYYNEANTLYMQEQYGRAIATYQRSYSPDSVLTGQVLYNRANALLRSGKVPEAIESYVQALQYLPDDVDARHNLEMALKMMQQQKQQQQQQQGNDNQQNEKNQDSEQEQQNQQQQEQQQGDQEQEEQQQGEQERQEQQEPDSTQTPEPQMADSTAAPPQAQLTPEDMMQLSKEDAMRILQALEEQEKKLQEERRHAAFRRLKKNGKDW